MTTPRVDSHSNKKQHSTQGKSQVTKAGGAQPTVEGSWLSWTGHSISSRISSGAVAAGSAIRGKIGEAKNAFVASVKRLWNGPELKDMELVPLFNKLQKTLNKELSSAKFIVKFDYLLRFGGVIGGSLAGILGGVMFSTGYFLKFIGPIIPSLKDGSIFLRNELFKFSVGAIKDGIRNKVRPISLGIGLVAGTLGVICLGASGIFMTANLIGKGTNAIGISSDSFIKAGNSALSKATDLFKGISKSYAKDYTVHYKETLEVIAIIRQKLADEEIDENSPNFKEILNFYKDIENKINEEKLTNKKLIKDPNNSKILLEAYNKVFFNPLFHGNEFFKETTIKALEAIDKKKRKQSGPSLATQFKNFIEGLKGLIGYGITNAIIEEKYRL